MLLSNQILNFIHELLPRPIRKTILKFLVNDPYYLYKDIFLLNRDHGLLIFFLNPIVLLKLLHLFFEFHLHRVKDLNELEEGVVDFF